MSSMPARAIARAIALRLEPHIGHSARLQLPASLLPRAGQFLLVLPAGPMPARRWAVFPRAIEFESIVTAVPEGQRWAVGDELDVLGPLGRGFQPPKRSRRWLLAAPERSAGRLLPLLSLAADRGAEVALVTASPHQDLPVWVELNPPVEEAARWADYAAWDSGDEADLVRLGGADTDVLITPPMPCGTGACGACAVRSRRGWKLACVDGPVFPVLELRASS
jgi:dihydroorotate dehydrogenase electron transfer subunit